MRSSSLAFLRSYAWVQNSFVQIIRHFYDIFYSVTEQKKHATECSGDTMLLNGVVWVNSSYTNIQNVLIMFNMYEYMHINVYLGKLSLSKLCYHFITYLCF